MYIHELPQITTKAKRRVGLGHGSGRGKTAGRGTKGQNARSKRPLTFEGGAVSLIKRLPFLRGKGRNKSVARQPITIRLDKLNSLPKGSDVTREVLIKYGLVDKKEALLKKIKILSGGKLNVSLSVKLPVSKQAASQIKKAGGTVEGI